MAGNFEDNAILESLQQADADVDGLVITSKFVVAYFLQQGQNPGWRKANIEGPVFLVRRRSAPKYQLIVKNQFSTHDLVDNVHPDWELDCQPNYIFYKVEDSTKRIRGLWFHDDAERMRVSSTIEKTMEAARNESMAPALAPPPTPAMPPPSQQPPFAPPPAPDSMSMAPELGMMVPAAAVNHIAKQQAQAQGQGTIQITKRNLRSAIHAMAEDEAFIDTIMRKMSHSM
eukprot:TRINITY_DN523_c0_g1_i2.p1 TRINITY_DN523_c0_g1~~TRINITY_DN523_c0_g1_i2.p1  ORF type:complete len:256 (+),score=57.93 TRINITY_DN523_c0_g1_i2:84-770(+)